MHFRSFIALTLALVVCINPLQAEDTLASVMQRMQPKTAVQIAYQETRYLELLQEPWKATGFLYALAPDILVKEQQIPVREIMGASNGKLFYYDPINDVRHRGTMESNDPLSLNIAAFKALVTGNRQLLEKMYQIDFYTDPSQWTLALTGHGNKNTTVKIIVTGPIGQAANKIVVHQPDGDRSDFILAEAVRDKHLHDMIRQLKQELMGD